MICNEDESNLYEKKMFTKSYSNINLKKIESSDIFSANEHSLISEAEFSTYFNSRESLIRWYFSEQPDRFIVLPYLMKKIKKDNLNNIISLGAGPCVLEFFLEQMISETNIIFAVDFDSFFISNAKRFFPSIRAEVFDFFSDNMHDLQIKQNIRFDLALFFGSSYVMDDDEFINLFKQLREAGVQQIIDFQPACIPTWDLPRQYTDLLLGHILNYIFKFLKKGPFIPSGKFHGYYRSKGSIRSLYKRSGWRITDERAVGPYSYVAVLSSA